MLTTRPYLTTLRPSPTTILYTVSTASRRQTFPSQLVHAFLLLLRILLGLATSAVILSKAFTGYSSRLPPVFLQAIELWPWSHIGPLSFASFFMVFRRFHTGTLPFVKLIRSGICENREATNAIDVEESLLTLRSLGIQTSTLSPSYLVPSNTRFIPTAQIRDIFIHEAFKGFEVRYYLAVVVEGEGEVVVVFPVRISVLSARTSWKT